jgi:putative aldouronate transport system permease protein
MLLSRREKVFNLANYVLLFILAFLTVFPVLYVVSVSLTPLEVLTQYGGFVIVPPKVTFDAYRYILSQDLIPRAYLNTIIITLSGTTINMVLTLLMAYPLSRTRMPGRKLLLVFVLIPMLFSGGLIPLFILIKDLTLINSFWAVILPGAISTYNLLLMKSFFEQLPQDLFECAYLDGASEFTILSQIVLPLSTPVIATLTLFYAVAHWNSFFYALMFLTDKELQPLQVILRDLLTGATRQEVEASLEYTQLLPGETLKMAAVMLSIIPLLIVYPFLQKYFTKGLLLGSIKG